MTTKKGAHDHRTLSEAEGEVIVGSVTRKPPSAAKAAMQERRLWHG